MDFSEGYVDPETITILRRIRSFKLYKEIQNQSKRLENLNEYDTITSNYDEFKDLMKQKIFIDLTKSLFKSLQPFT